MLELKDFMPINFLKKLPVVIKDCGFGWKNWRRMRKPFFS